MKKIKFLLITVLVLIVSISCSKEEENYYVLTVTMSTGWNCSVSRTLISGKKVVNDYSPGSDVELTVLPCSGYSFSHWSSPIPSLDGSRVNPKRITMNQDIEISPVFVEN